MSELRALMREDDDTASTGSEDPDAEDRATVTTVTIGDLEIVTQEATHAFGASGADQSGNVVWGAARVLAERLQALEVVQVQHAPLRALHAHAQQQRLGGTRGISL